MRIAMAVFLLVPLVARAEDKTIDPVLVPAAVDLKNRVDPVSDKPIGKESFKLDWNGVRVHFASPESEKEFRAEPAKHLTKLGVKLVTNDKGATFVDLCNAKCACGSDAEPAGQMDRDGVRTHFCCTKCSAMLTQDPSKVYAKLGYAYVPPVIDVRNTVDPGTGKPFGTMKTFMAEHDGIRVHFASAAEAMAFHRDPAAVFAKLGVDPVKLKASMMPHPVG